MPDAPEILVGWSGYEGTPHRELTFSFWCRDEDDKLQHLRPREVEREGDRFFLLTLPDGTIRRFCQRQSGLLEWVASILGGDPQPT
jgi:hypothetical protein